MGLQKRMDAWVAEQGGQKHFWGKPPLFWIYLTLLVTLVIRAHIFCSQTTQELPKKHHDARMPEQLTTNALSQINYRHTRHYEDCKEVCLCQQTMQTAFWKICVRGMRMTEWKISLPLSKCSAVFRMNAH